MEFGLYCFFPLGKNGQKFEFFGNFFSSQNNPNVGNLEFCFHRIQQMLGFGDFFSSKQIPKNGPYVGILGFLDLKCAIYGFFSPQNPSKC